VLNGIWYVLWTGCQWKAVHRSWFGVCSSVLHERFQRWQQQGIWHKILRALVRFYARQQGIRWRWQALDSKSCPAPLGGTQTGRNPTDRGKHGSKLHILVDQRGAPLAVQVTGTNQHDKWSVVTLIFSVVVRRPTRLQHLCADKAYDSADIFEVVRSANYVPHIKHRQRRNEPVVEPSPDPLQHPARRWVVERTLAWLVKRRSLHTRWCKKGQNWLALIQFACAHILFDLAVYG
jgi:transposase